MATGETSPININGIGGILRRSSSSSRRGRDLQSVGSILPECGDLQSVGSSLSEYDSEDIEVPDSVDLAPAPAGSQSKAQRKVQPQDSTGTKLPDGVAERASQDAGPATPDLPQSISIVLPAGLIETFQLPGLLMFQSTDLPPLSSNDPRKDPLLKHARLAARARIQEHNLSVIKTFRSQNAKSSNTAAGAARRTFQERYTFATEHERLRAEALGFTSPAAAIDTAMRDHASAASSIQLIFLPPIGSQPRTVPRPSPLTPAPIEVLELVRTRQVAYGLSRLDRIIAHRIIDFCPMELRGALLLRILSEGCLGNSAVADRCSSNGWFINVQVITQRLREALKQPKNSDYAANRKLFKQYRKSCRDAFQGTISTEGQAVTVVSQLNRDIGVPSASVAPVVKKSNQSTTTVLAQTLEHRGMVQARPPTNAVSQAVAHTNASSKLLGPPELTALSVLPSKFGTPSNVFGPITVPELPGRWLFASASDRQKALHQKYESAVEAIVSRERGQPGDFTVINVFWTPSRRNKEAKIPNYSVTVEAVAASREHLQLCGPTAHPSQPEPADVILYNIDLLHGEVLLWLHDTMNMSLEEITGELKSNGISLNKSALSHRKMIAMQQRQQRGAQLQPVYVSPYSQITTPPAPGLPLRQAHAGQKRKGASPPAKTPRPSVPAAVAPASTTSTVENFVCLANEALREPAVRTVPTIVGSGVRFGRA
ncbi:hypothetical protein LTR04_001201 [Oleoguttula sp. CCFEE 6159]|nr:hypothetical protein LTR04_001201 [Oleoguttula sp. CCFEE 6159]